MTKKMVEQYEVPVCNQVNDGGKVCEYESLRNRTRVFRGRAEAGRKLVPLLERLELTAPLILGIPAGGVPVAAVLAATASCPVDVAVVSKITLPWNQEAGYGAVAFDGSHMLNHEMIRYVGLSEQEVEQGIARTRVKVERRKDAFRGQRSPLELDQRDIVLVDDGLASGFTMFTAIEAIRRQGSGKVVVAVPTGHEDAVLKVAREVDAVCCANIRGGSSFAVAAAYEEWYDVSEEEAIRILQECG